MKHEIKLPVLKVRQPIGDFYIASMSPENLVNISYSDVRRLAHDERDVERYLGIQRPVSKKRISEIKRYIEANDATFPTSVILAIDEKCAEYEEGGVPQFGLLTLKPYVPEDGESSEEHAISIDKIAKVIDGQHRIAAFLDSENNWCFDFQDRNFDINVAIFVGADLDEQANIFATVNLAQTKVNRSLVYDLTELAKTPSPHQTCHRVAVALDAEPSSPLHKRIKRLGTATPGRKKEPLTQAVFVESLLEFITIDAGNDRNQLLDGKRIKPATVAELKRTPFRNLFIEQKDLDIAEILFNYFCAIRDKWPKSWDDISSVGNLLPRSNAFKAFMKFLREDILSEMGDETIRKIPKAEDFSPYFDRVEMTDSDFTTSNFVPGSGGQSMFLKMLRGQVRLKDMVISGA